MRLAFGAVGSMNSVADVTGWSVGTNSGQLGRATGGSIFPGQRV